MYHYDPNVALEELKDDAVLPHPVHLRDMILRTKLNATLALDLNRDFQDYLARFGDLQKIARKFSSKSPPVRAKLPQSDHLAGPAVCSSSIGAMNTSVR